MQQEGNFSFNNGNCSLDLYHVRCAYITVSIPFRLYYTIVFMVSTANSCDGNVVQYMRVRFPYPLYDYLTAIIL